MIERILETKKAAPGERSGHRYRIALAAVCRLVQVKYNLSSKPRQPFSNPRQSRSLKKEYGDD
jgi:hypothetical protein